MIFFMFRFLLPYPTLLCTALLACSEEPKKKVRAPVVLARVGEVEITDIEFERSLAKLGEWGPTAKALEEWHRQFQLLIDKQLLLIEAAQQGIDRQQEMKAWERLQLIEALLQADMAAQLSWDEGELENFFRQKGADWEVRLSRLVLNNPAQAMEALQRFRKGETFERLIATYTVPDQLYSNGDIGWINPLSTNDPRLAPLLLLELGDAKLIEVEGIYFLLAVMERRQVSLAERRQLAEQVLKGEKWAKAEQVYMEYLLGKYQVRLDTMAIEHLLNAAPGQVNRSLRLVRSTLEDWIIGAYLEALENLSDPKQLRADSVPALSFQVTRTYVVNRLLVTEAREKGLYKEIVQRRKRVRQQKMIEALWERQELDQITFSEAELRAYYLANKDRYSASRSLALGRESLRMQVSRDLREEKAAPLFDAYLARLRDQYRSLVSVEEVRFREFVARKRRAGSPLEF